MWLDKFGWGIGAQDVLPPIAESDPGGRKCSELALRLALEAAADVGLGAQLQPLFANSRREDLHAQLVRFLGLTHRLLRDELPRLRRLVRCQSHLRSHWDAQPRGGRVDPIASLRRSSGTPPREWLVRRAERFAETPVNRLLAALLRRVATVLLELRAPLPRLSLLRRERSIIEASTRAVATFLALSPLGALPTETTPLLTLRQQAAGRREELRRFTPFFQWYDEFDQTDLQALRRIEDSTGVASTLSVHTSYEQVAALALLLALRDKLHPQNTGKGGLRFRAVRGEVEVHLGAEPDGLLWGRPLTLLLRLHRQDGTAKQVFVEARNFSGAALRQTAAQLDHLLFRVGQDAQGVLISPAPLPAAGGLRQVCLGLAELEHGPLRVFDELLMDLLAWMD